MQDSPHDPGQSPGASSRAAAVLIVLGILFLIAQLLDFAHGRDQAIFALVADAIQNGGAPYRDAWDFKTPGIYAIYHLARTLFGTGELAIRILEAWAILISLLAFLILSRRFTGSLGAGLIGALVATLGWVELGYWHTGQPESFAVPLLAWALVLSTGQPRSERTAFLAHLASGALYTAAALLKPPLGGGFLVSLVAVSIARKRLLAPLLAFGLGAAAILAATLSWFAAKGALDALVDTLFRWTPHYTSLSIGLAELPSALLRAMRLWLLGFSPFHAPGLVLLAVLPPPMPAERKASLHILGVIAFSLLGVALQGKFFEYHFGAAIPLAGLLAGWGYWKFWLRLRTRFLGMAVCAALALAILAGAVPTSMPGPRSFWHRCAVRLQLWRDPAGTLALRDELYSRPDSPAGPVRQAADWIRQNTPEDASLYVWGFEPALYLRAERPNASRYIYNVPQRVEWSQVKHRGVLLDELGQARPEIVIVQHGDHLPWVVGNSRDSAQELEFFPEIADWLVADYALTERFDSLAVYRRK